jgi:3-hydroxyisobutyrate dehydrogenase-like beta-hydroxyacid dehydrogenase
MSSAAKKTGVIGLGDMGYQMARHMVNNGFRVSGFDVVPKMMERAKAAGIMLVSDPAETGAGADVVVVMVATDEQVVDVVQGSGLLEKLPRGAVICIAASCSPETARAMEAAAKA